MHSEFTSPKGQGGFRGPASLVETKNGSHFPKMPFHKIYHPRNIYYHADL